MEMNDENPNYLFELLAVIDDPQERARTRREWGLVDIDDAESNNMKTSRDDPHIPSVRQRDGACTQVTSLTNEPLKR